MKSGLDFLNPIRPILNPIGPILHPKRAGHTAKTKPAALVISNHLHAIQDSAVALSPILKQYEGEGYRILNKKSKSKQLNFETDPRDFHQLLSKPQGLQKITIFSNTHGNPGCHFGEFSNLELELNGIIKFANLVREIEIYTRADVTNVVLGGCFSGTELYNPTTGHYTSSSARLLSILLPEKNIVGFIGEYTSGKVTHVYIKSEESEQYQEIKLVPEKSAVLFQNGVLCYCPSETIYCNHQYTAQYILEALDLEVNLAKASYYKPYFNKADLESLLSVAPTHETNLGLSQLQEICKIKSCKPQELTDQPSSSPSLPPH